MKRINLLCILLYLVPFVPTFAATNGKIDLSGSTQNEDTTMVQKAITTKCGSGPSECRTDEVEHYKQLVEHIELAAKNYKDESEKIDGMMTLFNVPPNKEQKIAYLYARFVHASIAGCKHEATNAKTVLPSYILHCVQAVEPQNRTDSIELSDKVDFLNKGETK